MWADYRNCLVNLACSVLKEFGAEASHETLPAADRLLRGNYKNLVILLLDGMGADALKRHLAPDGFFRKNLVSEYSSVFPPTTTAATTSLLTGRTPFETGWIGWKQYFKEIDQIVVPFQNIEYYTGKPAADRNTAGHFIPIKTIFEQINERGNGRAYFVSPFGATPVDTFRELTDTVTKLCAEPGKKFIYGYWPQPDSLMHENGCDHRLVTEELRRLERGTEEMAESLSDTLLFVTADHGHKNLTYYTLSDYPEILRMLLRPPAVEARASAFYVREECREEFPAAFQAAFGTDFILYPKEEVKRLSLFGDGAEHPKFDDFLGDYLAVGISDKGIIYSDEVLKFVSEHAGMSEQEMVIPLIAYTGGN